MAEIYNQNSFVYGEIGNKLSGYRDSEIAASSAKILRNVIVEETGIPIAAKQYAITHIIPAKIFNILETSFDYNVIATATTLYLVNKDNSSTLASLSHGLTIVDGIYVDMTMVEKGELCVVIKGQTPKFFTVTESNTIAVKDFFVDMLYPIEDKQTVEIDLIQVGKVNNTTPKDTQLAYIGTKLENPKLYTDGSGNVKLVGSNIAISRFYTSYKSPLDGEDFTGLTDGMVIAIFRNIEEVTVDAYYNIGNSKVTFSALVNDSKYKGDYFVKMNEPDAKGEFAFGKLEDIRDFDCCTIFQDRFVLALGSKMYYSKIGEYNNFRNGVLNSDSFNIRPKAINNNRPDILKMISSEGMYAITDRGVYISGYNGIVTPANSGLIQIVSDIPATTESELIGRNLYYLSNRKILKCVQRIVTQTNVIDFEVVNVEKYSTKNFITHISKTTINDNDYLVASQIGKDQILLYEALNDPNLFRRSTLDFNHFEKVIGIRDTLLTNIDIHSITENNYAEIEIFFTVPAISTKKGGSYMNDLASKVDRVVLKVLNEDREAIEGVYINEEPLVNLGESVEDALSVYSARTGFKLKDGFNIRILTNQNTKALEFQGVDMYITIKND